MKKTNGFTPTQEKLQSILEYKKITRITRNELIDLMKKYIQEDIRPYDNSDRTQSPY